MERVSFTEMRFGSAEEFQMIADRDQQYSRDLPQRLLAQLRLQEDDDGGYRVNRLQHVLQCATRAWRDGASDEWIAAALLHDLGDTLAPDNHGAVSAEILKPFVSEEIYWVIRHHGVFQGYYYWHHLGKDQHARENYRGHPHFAAAENFCARWDQNSFDPAYDTKPLEFFEPVLNRVFRKRPAE